MKHFQQLLSPFASGFCERTASDSFGILLHTSLILHKVQISWDTLKLRYSVPKESLLSNLDWRKRRVLLEI